jgi:hypothetical protein
MAQEPVELEAPGDAFEAEQDLNSRQDRYKEDLLKLVEGKSKEEVIE